MSGNWPQTQPLTGVTQGGSAEIDGAVDAGVSELTATVSALREFATGIATRLVTDDGTYNPNLAAVLGQLSEPVAPPVAGEVITVESLVRNVLAIRDLANENMVLLLLSRYGVRSPEFWTGLEGLLQAPQLPNDEAYYIMGLIEEGYLEDLPFERLLVFCQSRSIIRLSTVFRELSWRVADGGFSDFDGLLTLLNNIYVAQEGKDNLNNITYDNRFLDLMAILREKVYELPDDSSLRSRFSILEAKCFEGSYTTYDENHGVYMTDRETYCMNVDLSKLGDGDNTRTLEERKDFESKKLRKEKVKRQDQDGLYPKRGEGPAFTGGAISSVVV